jgi:hypothetical protein
MINYNLVKVYNWFDIEKEICKRVGVENLYECENDTGEYRNFWHKALDCFIPDSMKNDSTVTLCAIEDWEDNKDWYLNQYGAWTEQYFQAYYDIMMELDPNIEGIEVRFSW